MDDDFERDTEGGHMLDRTMKSSDEKGDLRKSRVKMEDYSRKRSQSAALKKKGKYGVTVPRPFRCAMVETSTTKSIRQMKIDQMIAEKKME
jgi:hypothetical protein